MNLKRLLLIFIITLVLVTPVSADRVIKTEQVERSSSCTVMFEEMGDIEYFYVDNIFPELVLPENILGNERAHIESAHLSEINIRMWMIIDEDGVDIDKSVGIGVFLPGESMSESFGALKRGDDQSIYPKLDFVAPLEAVALDYYLVDPFCDDTDYPVYVTFNIEYYWEFSWIVSLKPVTTVTGGGSNLVMIVTFGVGGAFAILVVCFVEWDNRRRSRQI